MVSDYTELMSVKQSMNRLGSHGTMLGHSEINCWGLVCLEVILSLKILRFQ